MQLKLIAIGIVVAMLGGLIWHDHHLSKLYKAQKAKTAEVTVALETERANRKREQEINHAIDEQLIAANQALEAERSKPLPHLSCRLRNNASVSSTNPATGVDHADTETNDGGENAQDFDPSEALMEFAVEAQINRDGWQACEDWIRASR